LRGRKGEGRRLRNLLRHVCVCVCEAFWKLEIEDVGVVEQGLGKLFNGCGGGRDGKKM
jgi:hypothetical protein